jgi:hypothetical protein
MLVSHALQTDKNLQQTVVSMSQSLKQGESLFAINYWGVIRFKVVRDRKNLRKYCIGQPIYITNQRLESTDQVKMIGSLIKTMKREKQWIGMS